MISLLQILKMETLFHRGVGTSLNALGLDLNKATEVQLPDKPKLDDMAGAEFGPGAGKVSERAVGDTSSARANVRAAMVCDTCCS